MQRAELKLTHFREQLPNTMEAYVFKAYPKVAELKDRLISAWSGQTSMSGVRIECFRSIRTKAGTESLTLRKAIANGPCNLDSYGQEHRTPPAEGTESLLTATLVVQERPQFIVYLWGFAAIRPWRSSTKMVGVAFTLKSLAPLDFPQPIRRV